MNPSRQFQTPTIRVYESEIRLGWRVEVAVKYDKLNGEDCVAIVDVSEQFAAAIEEDMAIRENIRKYEEEQDANL